MCAGDAFGEEELLEALEETFTFVEEMSTKEVFACASRVIENFRARQPVKREYSVICSNREGGTVTRIQFCEYLQRVLLYRKHKSALIQAIKTK